MGYDEDTMESTFLSNIFSIDDSSRSDQEMKTMELCDMINVQGAVLL